MKKIKKCGACRWFDIADVPRTPTGRLKRGYAARCLWRIPPMDVPMAYPALTPLPKEITMQYVRPSDGATRCPCFAPRDAADLGAEGECP